jgi:hypothetical protein
MVAVLVYKELLYRGGDSCTKTLSVEYCKNDTNMFVVSVFSEWVIEWSLLNANSVIFQLYHGEKNFLVDRRLLIIIKRYSETFLVLFWKNTRKITCIYYISFFDTEMKWGAENAGVRTKPDFPGIRIICLSGATILSVDRYFNELVLYKYIPAF